ncbi:hypothetical protein RB628_28155 [Streptomyces sp. ADMS]|nr:hypothetical protein [Streptomyces sp. ADMS]MDW4909105.1 hypothetical protein [Streptomyces sp. ADMS]
MRAGRSRYLAGGDQFRSVVPRPRMLYLPNARFTTTPTPETAYAVVAVDR